MSSAPRRRFMFSQPLFHKTKASSGVRWRDSVYYYWWEYLRRHDGYRRACENKNPGKYGTLYADFGNVHAVDFKTWWFEGERGTRLFAEPPSFDRVEKLTDDDIVSLDEDMLDDSYAILVWVPLEFSRQDIKRQFSEVLARYHKRGRGHQVRRGSDARYRLAHNFTVESLKTALRVYDLHMREPELKLWEISQKEKLSETLTDEELTRRRGDADRTVKQKAMASAAFRKLSQAKKLIDGVGKGIFPAVRLGETKVVEPIVESIPYDEPDSVRLVLETPWSRRAKWRA